MSIASSGGRVPRRLLAFKVIPVTKSWSLHEMPDQSHLFSFDSQPLCLRHTSPSEDAYRARSAASSCGHANAEVASSIEAAFWG